MGCTQSCICCIPNRNDINVATTYARSGDLEELIPVITKCGVNCAGVGQDTPLHYAAHYGQLEVAKWLLEHGAQVDAKNKLGNTPLMCAAYKGEENIVKLLLRHGADPNATNRCNNHPLIWACIRNHIQTVRLLVGWGADVNWPGQNGLTALHWAVLLDRREIIAYLLSKGAKELRKDSGELPSELAQSDYVLQLLSNPKARVPSLLYLCLSTIRKHKKLLKKAMQDPTWRLACESDYYKHFDSNKCDRSNRSTDVP